MQGGMESFGTAVWLLLSVWALVHLLVHKREPSSTLAWILFVTLVPFVGAFVFLIFGPQRLERHAVKRKKEIARVLSLSPSLVHERATESDAGLAPVLANETRGVLALARRISEYGATTGNRVELLHDPHHALVSMQEAIDAAQHFVHLEYYIIANDEVTRQLFDSLCRAAERGVEVRILYDSLGSLSLKRIYFRPLVERGVKIAGFLPFSFLPQRINVNFRNHRKILVVDGKVAFTGGTNIGKEYLGRRNKNQWRDYSVRVQGPVCRQLEDVFAKDWHFTTQEDLFHTRYYPDTPAAGDAVVQVLESGPDSEFHSLHQAIFLALSSARREILLTTPYFIPDPAIMTALSVAALRGVTVKLLLPLRSDLALVQYASRSFYDDLLKAGVQIFEYQPRILHAKLLSIDGTWTILGSANMDIRSFRLNFELNLLVHAGSVAAQTAEVFQTDFAASRLVEREAFFQRPIPTRMMENACRLLSPIL